MPKISNMAADFSARHRRAGPGDLA